MTMGDQDVQKKKNSKNSRNYVETSFRIFDGEGSGVTNCNSINGAGGQGPEPCSSSNACSN